MAKVKLAMNQRIVLNAVKICSSGQLGDILYHAHISTKRAENALRDLVIKGLVNYSYPNFNVRIYEVTESGKQYE